MREEIKPINQCRSEFTRNDYGYNIEAYLHTYIETVLLHGQGMTLIMKDKDNCIPNSQLFAYTPIMLQLPNGKTCSSRDLHTEEYESVGYRDGLHYS